MRFWNEANLVLDRNSGVTTENLSGGDGTAWPRSQAPKRLTHFASAGVRQILSERCA